MNTEPSEKAVRNEVELNWGLAIWRHRSTQEEADLLVKHALRYLEKTGFTRDTGAAGLDKQISTRGWLRISRNALNLSGQEVARRSGISRAAYFQMEARERDGKVTLDNMKRMAAVMNCEFVYAIRPRGESYSMAIWRTLLKRIVLRPIHNPNLPAQVGRILAARAQIEAESPKVRRELGWTERGATISSSRISNSH